MAGNRVPGRLHRPSTAALVTFITEHKHRFGVEPICAVLTEFGLKIAPSTYYAALTRPPSQRAIRDEELKEMIRRIHKENFSVYGAKKVWKQLLRDRRQGLRRPKRRQSLEPQPSLPLGQMRPQRLIPTRERLHSDRHSTNRTAHRQNKTLFHHMS